MAIYTPSEELKQIAQDTIAEFDELAHLSDPSLRIAYQYSDQIKKHGNQYIYADTEVVKEKYRPYLPYEFIITFYESQCAGLDAEHLKRLMYHELRHVGFDGSNKFRVLPHDVEDFRACIEKWGIDWLGS